MPSARRVLAYGAAAAGGFVSGLLGSFVHNVTWYGVPVGLIVGLVLSLSVFMWAGLATSSRRGAAVAVTGWLLPVLVLTVRRPEGDLIVAGTALGYAWLIGGTVLAGAAVAWRFQRSLRDDMSHDRRPSVPEPCRR